jgi:hypothetical protein
MMLKALTAAAALAWSCGALAQASDDRMVLESRPRIEGISCKFITAAEIDRAAPGAHLWVPTDELDLGMPMDIPRSDLGFLERATSTQFRAQALLYPRSDAQGQQYYMVRMVMISETGSQEPSVTDRHTDIAWQLFESALPAEPADSEHAHAYLASVDSEASQKAAAEAAAADRAQAQQTYLNSPEYKRKQLREAAAKCRSTIAWAQRVIEQDDRVAAISGYHNINDRQSAAIAIVECQDKIRAAQAIDGRQ